MKPQIYVIIKLSNYQIIKLRNYFINDYFYRQNISILSSLQREKNFLVIRLSAMGDVAMTVPIIRAFIEQYPDAKITFVSKDFLELLFDDINNVTFYTADVTKKHKGVFGLYKLYRELKELEITHIADLHNVTRSKTLRFFFRLSAKKIAFIDKGRAEKKALTRTKNKIFEQLKTSHQRYADVFEKLGFPVDISNPKPILKSKLSKKILEITDNKTQQWIGIAPFATYKSKTYPLDLMEKVIEELSKEYKTFLFGGKENSSVLQSLSEKHSNTISVANKLGSFKDELILISNLDLMLSMDSSNAHFAAIQQIPTITLWGATHPFAGFAPYHQPKDYCLLPNLKKYPNIPCSIYGNKTCENYGDIMRTILPKEVVRKIKDVLEKQ